MSQMDQFKIRELANEGIKVELFLPGGGKTEHWLIVR